MAKNNSAMIILVLVCMCAISSSLAGALYYFRCDLELTDCPAPEPDEDEDEEVKGCTDYDANNYDPNATVDDETCTYDIYDTRGVVLDKKDDPWNWGDYIKNAKKDEGFTNDDKNTDKLNDLGIELKKFDTKEDCTEYIDLNVPDARIAIYRNENHSHDAFKKTCGYIKKYKYNDGITPITFQPDNIHHASCVDPNVSLDSGCQ